VSLELEGAGSWPKKHEQKGKRNQQGSILLGSNIARILLAVPLIVSVYGMLRH
jgi:hypothetical protein